jgi:hypothetical protein
LTDAIRPAAVDDESPPVPALAPLAPFTPPAAPEDDEPPVAPDAPVADELPALTDELPIVPVPDEDEPIAPDGDVFAPVLDEPDSEEPVEPAEPLDDPDEPPIPPLLPAPLAPMLPVAPALLAPPMPEPVDGLALDDEPPDMLPDEPALADEPLLALFRLLDLSSLPRFDWSLPMPLPCLLASTPFPSLDF